MRRMRAAQIVDCDIVFILTIDWAGQTIRVASRTINIDSDSGETYCYPTGLTETVLEEEISIGNLTISNDTTIEAYLGVDIAALEIGRGVPLDSATAELSIVLVDSSNVPNHTFEKRFRLISGEIQRPYFSFPDQTPEHGWCRFTLTSSVIDTETTILNPRQKIDNTTFDDYLGVYTDQDYDSEGAFYPFIFGKGAGSTGSGAFSKVPLYTVSSGAVHTRGILSRERLEADTVTVQGEGGTDTATVYYDFDDLGQLYAYIAVNEIDVSDSISAGSKPFYVGFYESEDKGASYSVTTGSAIDGAGDLLVRLLSILPSGVDLVAWENISQILNQYKFSGFIGGKEGSDVTVWDFISRSILPYLPLAIAPSPDGLIPVLLDLPNPKNAIVGSETEGPAWQRQTPLTTVLSRSDRFNAVSFQYQHDSRSGQYRRTVNVGPFYTAAQSWFLPDSGSQAIADAQASFSRYGLIERSFASEHIDDTATATRIASDLIGRACLQIYQAVYDAPKTVLYQIGDVIEVTDSSASIDAEIAWVIGRAWTGATWRYKLEFRLRSIV